jgi:CheY-like chemotaxis protein
LDHVKTSILCVDDEENALLMRKLVLERAGYEVATARSAAEALELISRKSFDLVLADYVMPKMNGAELAAEVKSRNPHAPVVLLSALEEEPEDAGQADLFLRKTEGPTHLVEVIVAVLKSKNSSVV